MKPKTQKKELRQIQDLINEIDNLKDMYLQEKAEISRDSKKYKQ